METATSNPNPVGLNFVAIDFETANHDLESVCQVGIARFENGTCVEQRDWVIDPEGEFLPRFVGIHGIEARHAEGAPLFPDIFHDHLLPALQGQVVVSHGHFDRGVLMAACARYGLELPTLEWMNSIKLARRTWKDAVENGLKLSDLARRLDVQFRHHQAGEDARVAGQVVVAAASELGLDIAACVERCGLSVRQAFSGQAKAAASRADAGRRGYRGKVLRVPSELRKAVEAILASEFDGEERPLEGHSVAFTGTLSVFRELAEQAVRHLGGECTGGPTQRSTIFVAGTPNILQNKGQLKGAKYRKAEELIDKGQDLRILREADFVRWLVEAWAG